MINDWTLASFVVFPVKIIAIILALIILVRAVEFARHMVQAKLNIPYKGEYKCMANLQCLFDTRLTRSTSDSFFTGVCVRVCYNLLSMII